VVNVITLAGMLVVMWYLDWRFTLVALSVAPVLFTVVYRLTRRIKRASRARLVLSDRLSAGALLVFVLYLGKMYEPMRDLSKEADTLSKAAVGFERIAEVLATESQVRDLPGARPAPVLTGRIEFDHVRFGYDPARPVFTDLDVTIEPGQFVALVGPSGSGKSTLIGLIPRLYDVLGGEIRIGRIPVQRLTLTSLRRQVSFVLQDTVLFHASVADNIAYGKPDATRADVIRAATLANAHAFIVRLPRGYDTMVGERGTTLSGGQRQLIAIARAVIRGAPVLLLDEPSTGLDAASEALVFEALDRLMEGKTCIVIAHRLATIMRADLILVLDDGAVVSAACTTSSFAAEASTRVCSTFSSAPRKGARPAPRSPDK
jgi:ATP-binding cassette, subfamily B, bacterial